VNKKGWIVLFSWEKMGFWKEHLLPGLLGIHLVSQRDDGVVFHFIVKIQSIQDMEKSADCMDKS
jgi:hypothetical protein